MKQIFSILVLLFLFISCKSKITPPTNEEAMEAIILKGKPQGFDTLWVTMPKKMLLGSSGGGVTIVREDDERKKINNWKYLGANQGFFDLSKVEEHTGQYFFSQEKLDIYEYLNPNPNYSSYFKDNPKNTDEWNIAWAIQQNFHFVNYKFKEQRNSYRENEVTMFFENDIVETPLNKIFQLTQSKGSPHHLYYVFQKDSISNKWKVSNYGFARDESLELTN